mgnify:CR=1 FL=1
MFRPSDKNLSELALTLIQPYTTALAINDIFIGSGTFVSCDDHHGILTAQHVAREIKPRKDGTFRIVVTSDMEHAFRIPACFLEIIDIGIPISNEYGPDISFIKIPHIFLSGIKCRKLFFNISNKRDEYLTSLSNSDICIWTMYCITNKSHSKGSGEKFGVVLRQEFIPYIFTDIDNYLEKAGFDYIEVVAKFPDSERHPSSFGGTSGAAIWKSPFKQIAKDRVELIDPILAGVVFFETELVNCKRTLRCHGYKTLYDQVYSTLSDLEHI